MSDPNLLISALEYLQKGEWDLAHKISQENEGDPNFDWIHARLHKNEGDKSNSQYWYRTANQDHFSTDADEELALMESHFLNLVSEKDQ